MTETFQEQREREFREAIALQDREAKAADLQVHRNEQLRQMGALKNRTAATPDKPRENPLLASGEPLPSLGSLREPGPGTDAPDEEALTDELVGDVPDLPAESDARDQIPADQLPNAFSTSGGTASSTGEVSLSTNSSGESTMSKPKRKRASRAKKS